MGRLIDADNLIQKLKRTSVFEYVRNSADKNVFEIINEQPTAYNVEKVVEEMEEHRANFDCRICKYNKTEGQVCLKDCTEALIDGLFDIVKRGGLDERA